MPRETIRPIHDDQPELQVQWGAHEVQFGIETPPDPSTGLHRSLVDHLYGDAPTQTQIGRFLVYGLDAPGDLDVLLRAVREAPDSDVEAEHLCALGRHVLNAVTASSTGGGWTGLWTTLGRPGLNRVVKVTRRARDVVHGKDE